MWKSYTQCLYHEELEGFPRDFSSGFCWSLIPHRRTEQKEGSESRPQNIQGVNATVVRKRFKSFQFLLNPWKALESKEYPGFLINEETFWESKEMMIDLCGGWRGRGVALARHEALRKVPPCAVTSPLDTGPLDFCQPVFLDCPFKHKKVCESPVQSAPPVALSSPLWPLPCLWRAPESPRRCLVCWNV